DWLPLAPGKMYSARIREVATTNTLISKDTMVLSISPKLLSKLPKFKPGMVVQVSTKVLPEMKNARAAIGGAPRLVRDGKALTFKDTQRNPRTAVGFNKQYVFFVVVDGRRKGVSDGMTFDELAEEMKWWGCQEAMNLDGGGSATIWVNGEIMNQ